MYTISCAAHMMPMNIAEEWEEGGTGGRETWILKLVTSLIHHRSFADQANPVGQASPVRLRPNTVRGP